MMNTHVYVGPRAFLGRILLEEEVTAWSYLTDESDWIATEVPIGVGKEIDRVLHKSPYRIKRSPRGWHVQALNSGTERYDTVAVYPTGQAALEAFAVRDPKSMLMAGVAP